MICPEARYNNNYDGELELTRGLAILMHRTSSTRDSFTG